MWTYNIVGIISLVAYANSLSEGDSCTKKDGSQGVCKAITNCPSALEDIKRHSPPTPCGFVNFDPIVCCGETVVPEPVTPKKRGRGRKTTTTQRPVEVKFSLECPIAERTGRKAYDKCLEYQEKYVYPCRPGPTQGMVRVDQCNREPEGLITGGENAKDGEFPHMALLGYGEGSIVWMCGGVIISERFVLTAGHCSSSRSHGVVKKILVGILKSKDDGDPSRQYDVTVKKHPDYKPPSKYNDIALLKTDRDIQLSRYVVPACLHDGGALSNDSAVITGWGTTVFRQREVPEVLQKATVTRFEDSECSKKFKNLRHMAKGYDAETQLCYGDRVSNKDSCEGDSGGPLQVNQPNVRCMYWIIGITSWGKWCGVAGEPGIYTRVSHYLQWIENEVWP
ncbi:unnamed protein product [Leptosia nina]|uniref:Uncharacterized protein n=1 Tax=Leptosia nina TaxID=320188 RepID=A0AAV1JYC2_9NEOP